MVVRLTDTFTPTLLNEVTLSYVDSHITLADINGPGADLQPLHQLLGDVADKLHQSHF